MNTSGDAAEQIVRMSLEGFQVTAKIAGSGAKDIAALLIAIMKDKHKTAGKTNLSNMYGSINCDGSFGILTGNTTSGDINLSFKDNLKNVFITSVSGDIELNLPLSSGYEVSYSTLSGTLNANKDDLFNTDKSNKINVRTNSGNLNVYKD